MASADARNEARLAAEAKKKADEAAAKKPLTQAEIDAKTAAVVAAGGKSTDRANRLEGETATQANARITAAYKAQAQPELTVEGKAAGATIEFVRTGAGGVGTYKEVFPMGAAIPETRTTNYGNVYDSKGNLVSGTGLKTSTGGKTVIATVVNSDGSSTVSYSDGTSAVIPKKVVTTLNPPADITGNGLVTSTTETGPTTNVQVLKAALRNLGFSAAIIDSSTSFLTSLLKEGLDYDNATEVFLNNKEYTLKSGAKIESPFYTEYGYLNEGLVVPKSANEIFNAVEGYKEVVDKYALSKKYLDKDSLKNYVKNNVTAKDLAERANIATLKSVNQDPAYVEALQKLGYIATAADLKDFFMDPKIGQEQLNINRTTGAFAAEAIRRAQSGIQFNSERFRAIAQTMVEKGVSETEASTLAAQGFENIAAQLGTTTKLSGIYENQRAATMGQVQSELEKEEFSGLESERRKRLKAQEEAAFKGTAGTTSGSLRGSNVLGLI
jgi:hypothetical protein